LSSHLKKVSAHIITFNQKDFIRDCLEGAVNQRLSYSYEIIVGDDCSSDGTREVLIEYQQKYPNLIRLVLFDTRNKGIPGKINFTTVLKECSGSYVALCDGDDYWSDPLKLQKQIDFLETHADFSICFHRTMELYPDGSKKMETFNTSSEPKIYTINDLARGNFLHTPSVVFRNNLGELPKWFYDAPVGDLIIHMLGARTGKIYYLPDAMAVYRVGMGLYGQAQDLTRLGYLIATLRLLLKDKWPVGVRGELKDNLQKANATARKIRFMLFLNNVLIFSGLRFVKRTLVRILKPHRSHP
jgi:glycosyltransferase involved in cell wall biosynthesis